MSEQQDTVRSIRDAAITRVQKEEGIENGCSYRDYVQGIEILLSCRPKNTLPSTNTAAPRRDVPSAQKLWSLDIWAGKKVLSVEWNDQSDEIAVMSFRPGDWADVLLST